jgi:hypothetical protein
MTSFTSSTFSPLDEDVQVGSRANGSNSSSDLKSPASTLSHKFDALEKTWSLYHKFGGLEKKWSQFSSSVASIKETRPTATPTSRAVKLVQLQDLEEKWAHLHAFATEEKKIHELQQRRRKEQQTNHPDEVEETRDDTEHYLERKAGDSCGWNWGN